MSAFYILEMNCVLEAAQLPRQRSLFGPRNETNIALRRSDIREIDSLDTSLNVIYNFTPQLPRSALHVYVGTA